MIRCDICFEEADYTCADPGVNPISYCGNCLPVWLRNRAEAGEFPLAKRVEESEEAQSATKKKKATSSNADND